MCLSRSPYRAVVRRTPLLNNIFVRRQVEKIEAFSSVSDLILDTIQSNAGKATLKQVRLQFTPSGDVKSQIALFLGCIKIMQMKIQIVFFTL